MILKPKKINQLKGTQNHFKFESNLNCQIFQRKVFTVYFLYSFLLEYDLLSHIFYFVNQINEIS